MLYDLLKRDLKGWHPREIIHTAGIVEQQNLNLDPLNDWWVDLLERGQLPGAGSTVETVMVAPSYDWQDEESDGEDGNVTFETNFSRKKSMRPGLFTDARKSSPKLRDASDNKLTALLRDKGCKSVFHVGTDRGRGRGWKFPLLMKARAEWEKTHPGWVWRSKACQWEPL